MRIENTMFVRGLTLVALVCTPSVFGAPEADLTPQLDPQTEHRFRVSSVSDVRRSIPEMDQDLTQTTDLTYFITRRINGSEDGVIEAELDFDRVVFRTQSPNLEGGFDEVIYDTGLRDPETSEVVGRQALEQTEFVAMQYAAMLDPLIGRALGITLTEDGAITEVNIPAELGDADLFSVEMIKDRFLPLFQIHPDGGSVPIGAEWSIQSRQDSGLGFDVISTTDWQLKSAQDASAQIDVGNEFSMGEVRRDSGFTLRDSSGSGKVVWDGRLGVLESLSASQSIRMAGRPPEIGGAEVELLVRSRIEITRRDDPWTIEQEPEPEIEEPRIESP